MSATAVYVITQAMRIFGIIDQTEDPTPTDIANNVAQLNDLLRSEHVDGAAQYLMNRVTAVIPAGVSGQISTFGIGTANPSYLVQVDAVAMRAMYCNDVSGTMVSRETRDAPIADVVRTTQLGLITKWHQERQPDGSVRVTVWQPPRSATPVLIDYGGRLAPITATDGSDIVAIPPEGIHDAILLLGRRIFSSYGRSPQAVSMPLTDSERVHQRWKAWALGQQWLRFVRY